ncbi:hypothetical protein KGF56_000500 [Candida oxycetoniae]|uniref:Cytochrome P450 n=1 Tax=Candida oxycetoniae TaxID=497107 RepID=A0AAI9X022_9ASCO|nr:uncharacterized protein KGF56_000500 [Candida oxycetoniae]KAI3406654.2 hypothetical protein KGF56_000500 [Candida oxycetoniae]
MACLTFKKKKKVLSERLNKRSIEHHIPLFSNELNVAFRKMMEEATGEDMSVLHHLQYFVLRCVISMAYGIHLDCFGSDMTFAREIITNEADIIRLRSPVSNLQDSVPLLRLLPILTNSSFARNCGVKREKYMSVLYDRLTKGIMQDEDDCLNSIVGKLVIEKCHNLLTDQEIHSICLTLISAGLDNTPLNLNYLLGVFSQPQVGLQYQMNALEEILKNSNGNLVLAWEQSNQPEMVNVYVYALILETLRHFTVLPLSLPRMTTKSIICNNIELPANTQLFMNAYAANHDIDRFDQPFKFCPERWLDRNTNTIKQASRTYQHFSFGAGSRMCAGHNLALREIYMFIVRLLLLFEINTPSTLLMNMDPFKNNRNPRATSFEPQPHYIQLKLRKLPGYERLHDIVTGI